MIYPEIELDEWLLKYGLSVCVKKCSNCEKEFPTNVPILIKGYAGLETPIHDCGRQFSAAVFTPITSETIKIWNNLFI